MLLQFQVTADDSIWVLDTDKMRYSRVSAPVTDLDLWENGGANVEEFGEIEVMNPLMEVYRLVGREPKTEGPGSGLTSVAILIRIVNTSLEIGVNANVPVKEPVCVKPIDTVRCEVLGQQKKI